jgi:hypothetical protein
VRVVVDPESTADKLHQRAAIREGNTGAVLGDEDTNAGRRHVRPLGPIDNIGKEANRWEEQFYLGANPETQVRYGVAEGELAAYAVKARELMEPFGVREISREAEASVGTVSAVKRGFGRPSLRVLRAIERAIAALDRERASRSQP